MFTRLIVLTDGFTRDPDRCRSWPRRRASAGIAVTTLGIGTEFNERLLTTMADESRGQRLLRPSADARSRPPSPRS